MRNIVSRKHPVRRILCIMATASMLGTGVAAHADDDRMEAAAIARVANLITPERAEELALAEKQGAVTDLELDKKWKTWVYEIELVDASGVEWEIELEAATGKLRKISKEWF
jgi:uncharacterized membrane protein YkoI